MSQFFVSCQLGHENALAEEVTLFWPLIMDKDGLPTREVVPEFKIEKGGIEFETSVLLGFQINLFTRIGLRVLLRIDQFKARYFDQLESGLKKIDWSKYFKAESSVAIYLESSKSRLFHEKNLIEVVQKSLNLKKYSVCNEKPDYKLFVRVFNDVVTVSIDTSGEHLHFRGYRRWQGHAPMRETLAAYVVKEISYNANEDCIVVDPFAGSGTLLFESFIGLKPHFKRTYAFFELMNLPPILKSETWVKNYRWINETHFKTAIGYELDQETFQKSLKNKDVFKDLFLDVPIEFKNKNSSTAYDELKETYKKIVVVANPPYGERLQDENAQAILKQLLVLPSLHKMIVVHPESWTWPKKNWVSSEPFSNQGLKVIMTTLKP